MLPQILIIQTKRSFMYCLLIPVFYKKIFSSKCWLGSWGMDGKYKSQDNLVTKYIVQPHSVWRISTLWENKRGLLAITLHLKSCYSVFLFDSDVPSEVHEVLKVCMHVGLRILKEDFTVKSLYHLISKYQRIHLSTKGRQRSNWVIKVLIIKPLLSNQDSNPEWWTRVFPLSHCHYSAGSAEITLIPHHQSRVTQ